MSIKWLKFPNTDRYSIIPSIFNPNNDYSPFRQALNGLDKPIL